MGSWVVCSSLFLEKVVGNERVRFYGATCLAYYSWKSVSSMVSTGQDSGAQELWCFESHAQL